MAAFPPLMKFEFITDKTIKRTNPFEFVPEEPWFTTMPRGKPTHQHFDKETCVICNEPTRVNKLDRDRLK